MNFIIQKMTEEIVKEMLKLGLTVSLVAFAEVIGHAAAEKLLSKGGQSPEEALQSALQGVMMVDQGAEPANSMTVNVSLGNKNKDNVINVNIYPPPFDDFVEEEAPEPETLYVRIKSALDASEEEE